jgi:hypothetical protein
MTEYKTTKPSAGVICMAFDAMRVALGRNPKNYQPIEVVTWVKRMGRMLDAKAN